MIQHPDTNPRLPQSLYKSNLITPKIEMKLDKTKGTVQLPTVDMYFTWFNEVRKFRFFYNSKIKKYTYEKIYGKDLGDVYIIGINTSLLKDQNKFIRCEFLHDTQEA